MATWERAFSIVVGVVMRKSLFCLSKLGLMALKFIRIFAWAVTFSGLFFRHPESISGDSGRRPAYFYMVRGQPQ